MSDELAKALDEVDRLRQVCKDWEGSSRRLRKQLDEARAENHRLPWIKRSREMLSKMVEMVEGIRDDKYIPEEEKITAVIRALKRWEKR